MDTIGFKLWISDLAIGEDGNALILRFLRKASKLIQNEINVAGGIAGKKMTITCDRIVKGRNGLSDLINSVNNTDNILFTHGPRDSLSRETFTAGIDLDSIILFNDRPNVSHPNLFDISIADQDAQSTTIQALLTEIPPAARILFIHDGKRMAAFEKMFTSSHKGQVKSIDFSPSNPQRK